MLTPSGFLVGFAYKAFAVDEATLYVVNVCGHDSVGLPLAKNMSAVDETYIEHNGIDNLIIPIAVSEARKTQKGEFAFCVDVIVHTMLIKKCTPRHHLFRHLTEKLLNLSIEWVKSECGVQLLQRSCSILGNPFYYSDVERPSSSVDEMMKLAAEYLKRESRQEEAEKEPASSLPPAFDLRKEDVKEPKKTLIQEVIATPGLKKGFLSSGGAKLYGPEGSSEGSGKPPDPLAHIPESLRNKCKVIDTRDLGSASGLPTKKSEMSGPAVIQPKGGTSRSSCADYQPPHSLRWEKISLDQTDNSVVVRFSAPETVASLGDVDLSATENALEIDGVVTPLPVAIVTDCVRAKFVKASRVLVVTCPIHV